MIQVHPICAFNDNYIWLLADDVGNAVVVDPGQAQPVIDFLERHDLTLQGVLITHHHHDHVGGLVELQQRYRVPAWGPEDSRIPGSYQSVKAHDLVDLESPSVQFEVIELPGHTMTHIAFINPSMAFVGDTLFSVGCGRLFEGSARDLLGSLRQLASLPPTTKIYCAHEYTESNCRFALQVEPENQDLQERHQQVLSLRQQGKPTVPTTIAMELKTNPFLRWESEAVRKAASARAGEKKLDDAQVLAQIRAWKDAA